MLITVHIISLGIAITQLCRAVWTITQPHPQPATQSIRLTFVMILLSARYFDVFPPWSLPRGAWLFA